MSKKSVAAAFSLVLGTLLGLLVTASAAAGVDVQVRGLFNNRALLEINGENRLLRAGEQSPEGVTLVSSNSREAVVRVNGVAQTLSLSRQIASAFTEARETEVRIPRDSDSHYRLIGAINGVTVKMMVDTGATAVAMNARHAERLGIDYKRGQVGQASTAGGMVESYLVDINRITVGDINVHNVKGVVIPGDHPAQILLGNTFLNHVTMEQDADTLILKSKY